MVKKIVLHTIDSPLRDFEWRLFVAWKLSQVGMESIIGSKSAVRKIHSASRNCIFLGRLNSNTGRSKQDKLYLKEMVENNTALFFLHDEGGLYCSRDYAESVARIYPPEFYDLPVTKAIFFWGHKQKDIYQEKVSSENRLYVTGFPRFDLYNKKYSAIDDAEVASIKNQHGNFVLICGRFAAANGVIDDPGALSERIFNIHIESGSHGHDKKLVLDTMFGSWSKVACEFSYFIPGVAKLAMSFPDLKFVVRPHPAEKQSIYNEAFSHFSNVTVSKSGDVRSFIRASDLVIHSECTTSIEAELCEKPNINFRPAAGMPEFMPYEVSGVNEVGVIVKDHNELIDGVRHFLENDFIYEPFQNVGDLAAYLSNVSSSDEASDLIVEKLVEFSEEDFLDSVINKRQLYKTATIDFVKDVLRPLVRGVNQTKKTARIVRGDSKNYTFSDDAIKSLWRSLGGKDQCLKIENGLVYTYPQ